jgi:hypothetical protein
MTTSKIEHIVDPDRIRSILHDRFGRGDWVIERPHQGAKKMCAIATSPAMRVFVKLDVRVDVLERLGEIGVAPPVLAHGRHNADTYVVQALIDGESPTREWLRSHAEEAGTLFRKWHSDAGLTTMLQAGSGVTYAAYLTTELSSLRHRLGQRAEPALLRNDVGNACQRLLTIPDGWDPAELVPVHDEPNLSNMLVGPAGLRFVDWDDIRLADPLRDLGPFLWWYLPERAWGHVLDVAGHAWTATVRAKVYWYAARASLDVALWHYENGHGTDRGFLADFVAAANLGANSRG